MRCSVGCYTALIDIYLPTIRDILLASSSINQSPRPLKMAPICCHETSAYNYQSMLPNILVKRRLKPRNRCKDNIKMYYNHLVGEFKQDLCSSGQRKEVWPAAFTKSDSNYIRFLERNQLVSQSVSKCYYLAQLIVLDCY